MTQLRKRISRFLVEQRGDETERAFAARIGISKSTLHRIENCEQNITIDTLEQLCQAFKCDIGDLFPK